MRRASILEALAALLLSPLLCAWVICREVRHGCRDWEEMPDYRGSRSFAKRQRELDYGGKEGGAK